MIGTIMIVLGMDMYSLASFNAYLITASKKTASLTLV